jgi:argininosuccinate lyase
MKMKNNINSSWGGAFSQTQDGLMIEINQSISFDKRLYKQDIQCSIAHAKMLAKQSIITNQDFNEIQKGLIQIQQEIENGDFDFKTSLEDIHMNIESRLYDLIGEPAKRLHTARSRNDQVATDFKLFVKDSVKEVLCLLSDLLNTITLRAEQSIDIFMPAYTHLQNAQPTVLAHHLLCYFEMLYRDKQRFESQLLHLTTCPLGSGAVTGTSYDIDRHLTARELGFLEPTSNSIDGVSDRDFAIDFLFNTASVGLHLSRMMEEFVIWSNSSFGFIRFSDKFSTGSSMMPQKKNPDAAELIRGKTGRLFGNLTSLMTTMKGLALAYFKDMQEDKEVVFDSLDTISLCLKATKGMILDFEVNVANMQQAAMFGHSVATDIADYLVKTFNLPFREAHHTTGSLVKLASQKGVNLWELSLEDFNLIDPRISDEVYKVIGLENSVDIKKSYGGTARSQVKMQIQRAKSLLKTT